MKALAARLDLERSGHPQELHRWRKTKTPTGSNTLTSTKARCRRETHTPASCDIAAKREHAVAHSKNSTERHRTQLAETLKDLHK